MLRARIFQVSESGGRPSSTICIWHAVHVSVSSSPTPGVLTNPALLCDDLTVCHDECCSSGCCGFLTLANGAERALRERTRALPCSTIV